MDQLSSILRTVWGYDQFRPLQAEAMQCVLNGTDSVVVLPTGGGKSLCFQAPALAMPGLAVVVSPLISLMKDQVDALADNGVAAAAAILAGSLARGGGWLRPDEVQALLAAYGISLVEQRRVSSPAAAAKAAAELGGPVALKGIAPGVVHKAQAGAVRLGLSGPTAVRRAAQEVADTLEAAGTPVEDFLVQRMVRSGVEMLVGVLADERFGPVVACGAGGGTADVIGDVGVRLAPLAREEALEMIRSLRSKVLLERANADVDALADIAVRVGALADAHPAIAELDLNPVMVGPDGAAVVDARVRVAPPAVQPVFTAVGR